MTSEAEIQLQDRASKVDLSKVGADTTYDVPIINELEIFGNKLDNKFHKIKTLLVAQALQDNLSNTERGLSLRWLMPDLDLIDSNGDIIQNREWWVPANGKSFQPDPEWTMPAPAPPMYKINGKPTDSKLQTYRRYIDAYNVLKKEIQNNQRDSDVPKQRRRSQTVFESNLTSRSDRKVIMLFGAGLGHGSSHTITSIVLKNPDATRQIISTDNMPDGLAISFERPELFRRSDDYSIVVTFPEEGWYGKRDKLVLYGFVAEMLGSVQMG
jgi:hypothetical protein